MNPLSSILLAATGIEADRSATFTSTVVIAGIVIVLGILVLLIFVFKAFGFTPLCTGQRLVVRRKS